MEPDLKRLFKEESAVFMISGRKGYGKTDFALKLGEDALEEGLIRQIATNIITKDERVQHVNTFPDLEDYLQTKGKKYFILDEAGKIISRMRFMSKLNVKFMNIIQLIRHFDGYFAAIAPSEKFIDSNFMNTDILDCRIKKVKLHFAEVKNYVTWQTYTLHHIERTSIKFSKHPAEFSMHRKMDVDKMPQRSLCAYYYGVYGSYDRAGQQFNPPMHKELVKRETLAWIRQSFER